MKIFLVTLFYGFIPYILAASAGLMSERVGIIQLGLEGMMLMSAFAVTSLFFVFENIWIAICVSILINMIMAMLFAAIVIIKRVDQVFLGIIFNIFSIGITRFFLKFQFNSLSNSPRIEHQVDLTICIIIFMCIFYYIVEKSPFSMRFVAAGDEPQALKNIGLNVEKYRMGALLITGILTGLAGVHLALIQHQFTDNMIAGRGYIAMAAVVFSGWRLNQLFVGCLLFAGAEIIEMMMMEHTKIPVQLLQVFPYMLCLIAFVAKKNRHLPPSFLGK